MGTPQARLDVAGNPVLLLGTIAGFVPDGERVRQAYEAFHPRVVALGVPPEDLATLDTLASASAAPAELPPLDDTHERLMGLLAPFGATRVPSPDLEIAHQVARADGVPLSALDLDDDAHATLYTKHVRFHHIIQSNGIKSRLLKRGVTGTDAYDVAANWDAAWTRPRGMRRVEDAREAHMAARLREVAAVADGNVLAVVPSTLLAGIVRALGSNPA
ncbi:MAG: hypothetical protein AABY18_06755 [Candidatus Thermoplasmatota archaeon]